MKACQLLVLITKVWLYFLPKLSIKISRICDENIFPELHS